MTPGERLSPEIIDKSRASRIAKGSGHRSKDVFGLVERFGQMREMMSSLGSPDGLLSKMGLGGIGDGFDPAGMLAAGAGGPAVGLGRRSTERKRTQQKSKRKAARKARKKNRKR